MIITSITKKKSGNGCGVFTYHYYNSHVINKHHFKSSVAINMKTFYYHVNWLPEYGATPDPQIIINDYKSGQITWREFLQEVIFLVDLYQEYRYMNVYKDSQFERMIIHLNKVISDSNLQFEL